MVFEVFRELSHLSLYHVLITIRGGRQRRQCNLHAAVEDPEAEGG